MKKLNSLAACCMTAGALLALPAAAVAQTDITEVCEDAIGGDPTRVKVGPVSATITTCADAKSPRCAESGETQTILVPGVIRIGTKLCKMEWS